MLEEQLCCNAAEHQSERSCKYVVDLFTLHLGHVLDIASFSIQLGTPGNPGDPEPANQSETSVLFA